MRFSNRPGTAGVALVAGLLLGCSPGDDNAPADARPDTADQLDSVQDDGAVEDASVESESPDVAEATDTTDTPAGCLVSEAAGDASIGLAPPFPRPGRGVTLDVTSSVAHANVGLVLCGPAGPVTLEGPEVFPGSPNLWRWRAGSLGEGTHQAQFSADPAGTLVRTLTFVVAADPADGDGDGHASTSAGGDDCDDSDAAVHPGADDVCGDGVDQDCSGFDETCDLCAAPPGNLLAHGEFEEGMSGLAPTGWEVRSPDMPGSCPGSPDAHVFLGSAAPGCSGQALVIDAAGTWDCYAVQTVSDYSTIESGRTYRFSAVVRSSGNAVNPAAWFVLGVQWVDAGDGFFGDEKNPRPPSAAENDFDWKILSFDLVAPAGAVRVLVWLTAHYPGRVEYDAVSVVRLD